MVVGEVGGSRGSPELGLPQPRAGWEESLPRAEKPPRVPLLSQAAQLRVRLSCPRGSGL